MKADALKKIVATRLKKLKKHFERLQDSLDPEVLHDFRLEMKKLKALIRLLKTTAIPRQIRLSKELKTYYSLTGNLRNLQLHEQRIITLGKAHRLKQPVAYLAWLNEEKGKTLQQLHAAAQTIDFTKWSKDLLLCTPAQLSAQNCQDYLALQLRVLTGILVTASFSDEALHDVRKVIKDMGYNRNYVGTYLSLLLPSALVKKEQADAIAEKLGLYHDLCLSLYFLQLPAARQIHEQEERTTLQELAGIIEADKRKMKGEVVQQLFSI